MRRIIVRGTWLLLIGLLALCGTAYANPEITVDLPDGATMDFVWIEPGTFTMGGSYPDDGPAHEVTITQGYWLGKTEITQGQWEAVVGTTPWSRQSLVQANPEHPAAWITWEDVQGLIAQLNAHEGSEVYGLPSEAEWEYACRAGTTTRWSSGDDEEQLGDYAWYKSNAWDAGLQYAQPVGTKLANPWGLFDMHGNVAEWVQDYWTTWYSSGAQTDPQGPSTGNARVVRGGDLYNSVTFTRSAKRDNVSPGAYGGTLGARLSRTGPLPTDIPTAVTSQTWGKVKVHQK